MPWSTRPLTLLIGLGLLVGCSAPQTDAPVAAWVTANAVVLRGVAPQAGAFNTGRSDPVRFVGLEYYLTRASTYDAVDAYVAANAPSRLAELRADLRPLRPDTADMFGFVQQVMAAPDKQARLDRARRVRELVEQLPHPPGDPAHAVVAHHAAQIVAFYEHYALPDADALVYRDAHAAQNLRWWRDRTEAA